MKSITANIVRKFKVVIILTIAAALSLGIYMYQGHKVTLKVDGEVTELVSYSSTVEELIEAEEINFKEGADINTPLDQKIEDNLDIIIDNPKNYTIEDNGETLEVVSTSDKVKEILKEEDIKLNEEDYTYPQIDDKISPGSSIRVYRVKTEVDVEESDIKFDEKVENNKDLEKGKTRVAQKGKKGIKETHIKKKYLNGVLISKEIKKEKVAKKPVTEIVEKGTKEIEPKVVKSEKNEETTSSSKQKDQTSPSKKKDQTPPSKKESIKDRETSIPSRGGSRSKKVIDMTATAYDLSFQSTGKKPGDSGYGITTSGTKAKHGSVAVDPSVIPLGTKLYIESLDGTPDYGHAIAADTGGAIKGNKIDLFFESAGEVKQFGRRKVRVHILN
ncbi:MAG TPA: 3D domain-containing protein [Tissierellaceae bacterium]|nr:3D domain-containing protein [Tissierellaceae bacterium]